MGMAEENYLTSVIRLGDEQVRVRAAASSFERQLFHLRMRHCLLDVQEAERSRRVQIADGQLLERESLDAFHLSLRHLERAELLGEREKIDQANAMMKAYYEQVLDGERRRNVALQQYKALSRDRMAALLGDV